MTGGNGRYTSNLIKALQNEGVEVYIACDDKRDGDFSGISPENNILFAILLSILFFAGSTFATSVEYI
jgi:hypothetical protein